VYGAGGAAVGYELTIRERKKKIRSSTLLTCSLLHSDVLVETLHYDITNDFHLQVNF
jgi:hypothetical protein